MSDGYFLRKSSVKSVSSPTFTLTFAPESIRACTISRFPFVENAAINGLGADRFTARTGDVLTDTALMAELSAQPWDVVLANIVADVIIPLSAVIPKLLRRDGVFICSGILNVRLDEVKAAVEGAGLHIERVESIDDWCAITARPT